MNKQALRKTVFFLKEKGNKMNKACKMGGGLFQEKMLLRKKMVYQEGCRLRIISHSLKNGLLGKVQLIHIRKVFFL